MFLSRYKKKNYQYFSITDKRGNYIIFSYYSTNEKKIGYTNKACAFSIQSARVKRVPPHDISLISLQHHENMPI